MGQLFMTASLLTHKCMKSTERKQKSLFKNDIKASLFLCLITDSGKPNTCQGEEKFKIFTSNNPHLVGLSQNSKESITHLTL